MKLNIKYISALFGIAFAGLTFTGCSDEVAVNNNGIDGLDGIVLSIPNTDVADFEMSRATSNPVAKEGNLDDLYLLVFKKTGNDSYTRVVCEDIKNAQAINSSLNSAYKNYKLNLEAGSYKFYLLGNLSHYAGSASYAQGLSSISDIENLNLQFDGLIPAGQLPMASLSAVKLSESATAVPGTEITISAEDIKNGKQIYVDLSFLCSKLRYTILFDKDSFSSTFGKNVATFNDNVTFSNIVNTTPLASPLTTWDGAYVSGIKTSALNPREYQASYPAKDGSSADLTGDASSWGNQRAWQGVAYIPENTNPDGDLKTVMTLKGAAQNVSGQSVYDIEKSVELLPGEASGLERGQMYDLVFNVKEYQGIEARIVAIEDWKVIDIYYNISGAHELIVETTKLSLSSETPAVLWYRSDVAPEKIKFEYPKISLGSGAGSEEKDFYIASVMKDGNGNYVLNEKGDYQIEVKVNPAVPLDLLDKIENEEGYKKADYMYFEIVAANLHKKIEFDPLKLGAYFTVTPLNVIIDVREYVASGIDEGYVDIELETNISENISFSAPSIPNITTQSNALSLVEGEGTTNLTAAGFRLPDGLGKVRLRLRELFAANDFWKKEGKYTINFKATSSDGKVSANEDVEITVKPFTTDYVIHFCASQGDWKNPHIYVYQCLELPGDLKGNNAAFAGKSVGYQKDEFNNNNAGLEYAFTNNIAFNGWLGYGGNVDPNQQADEYSGFIHLGGGFKPNGDQRFNPENSNKSIYNFEIDLNSSHAKHKSNWACATCRNYSETKDYNFTDNYGKHLFPGVSMEKEDDGWFKYTLTGVATPGKALIMFYDDHEWNDGLGDSRRYPNKVDGKDPVGIPLFDFADNEGWLVYDGNQNNRNQFFFDDKPTVTVSGGNGGGNSGETFEASGLYFRGDVNDWGTPDAYQFYKTSDPNVFKTRGSVSVPQNCKFKVANAGYSDEHGKSGSDDMIGNEYDMAKGGGDLTYKGTSYNGVISIKKKGASYTIKFGTF